MQPLHVQQTPLLCQALPLTDEEQRRAGSWPESHGAGQGTRSGTQASAPLRPRGGNEPHTQAPFQGTPRETAPNLACSRGPGLPAPPTARVSSLAAEPTARSANWAFEARGDTSPSGPRPRRTGPAHGAQPRAGQTSSASFPSETLGSPLAGGPWAGRGMVSPGHSPQALPRCPSYTLTDCCPSVRRVSTLSGA